MSAPFYRHHSTTAYILRKRVIPANFSFGSNGEVGTGNREVRFTPNSGPCWQDQPCPKSATFRLTQRNKWLPHSITLSALSINVAGTSSPIALAVFRLTVSISFVACWIGMSAGATPLRALPTSSAQRWK
jgi:hypothetical protein